MILKNDNQRGSNNLSFLLKTLAGRLKNLGQGVDRLMGSSTEIWCGCHHQVNRQLSLAFTLMTMCCDLNIYMEMDIQNLISVNKAKKDLEKHREHKIKRKLVQMNKDKLASNRPEREKMPIHVRNKIIKKKEFKTVHEKVKSKEIELQQNVNATTFVYRSEKYLRIIDKTKQALKLEQ